MLHSAMHHSLSQVRRLAGSRPAAFPLTIAVAVLAWGAGAASAQAQPVADAYHAPSVYIQGNWAEHGSDAATIGVTLPWSSWRSELWGGELRGHWDINLSRWSFDGVAGYNSINVLGITPTLRLRPNQGRSAWFWEAGIGGTLADDRYRTTHKEFSTTFNFASHIGLGVNFGARREHEVSVRVQHVSNASIKRPNPGENFVQLRYGFHF